VVFLLIRRSSLGFLGEERLPEASVALDLAFPVVLIASTSVALALAFSVVLTAPPSVALVLSLFITVRPLVLAFPVNLVVASSFVVLVVASCAALATSPFLATVS